MIDGEMMSMKTVLLSACAVALVAACSPAPGTSNTASRESASEAFSQKRPEAPASSSVPTVATAAAVTSPPAGATTPAIEEAKSPAATAPAVSAAAAPAAAPRVTQTSGQAAPPAAVVRVGGLPPGAGRETVQRVCSSCHAIGIVTARGRTEDDWAEVIGRMIGHGLEASDDDLQTVHAYLSRELPPK